MSGSTDFQGHQTYFREAMQSETIYRNGQRIFVVPDERYKDWALAERILRLKTALNYWRNGYKWRASWILAQR